MPDAEGFLRWASTEVPDARGYWPCQAVATHAISGTPDDRHRGHRVARLAPHPRALERRAAGLHGGGRGADAGGRRPWARPPATLPGSDAVVHGRDHRRPLRPDRVGRRPPGRRPGDLRGHAHLLGGVRRMADRRRPHQLPQHHAGALPRRRPEQRRRPLRRLGPPPAAWHAAPRAPARAARAPARAAGSGSGLAALRPGGAHALRGPHAALEHLRARHRLGCRGARAGRLRGERVRGAPDARALPASRPPGLWPVGAARG